MLEEIRESYELKAANIHSWRTISKEDLANLYFAYENDPSLKEIYFSCIVLKFWGMIGRMYISCKSINIPIETCYDWLIDSLMYVLEKRVWKDPSNKYYNHPTAFNMMVIKRLTTVKKLYLRILNVQSRSGELLWMYTEDIQAKMVSSSHIQGNIIGDNVQSLLLAQLIHDEYEDVKGDILCRDIVQHYLDDKKELNAVIINAICFSDAMHKANKKLVVDREALKEQILNSAVKSSVLEDYVADKIRLDKAYKRIQTASARRLNSYIRDTLTSLRNDPFVLKLVN